MRCLVGLVVVTVGLPLLWVFVVAGEEDVAAAAGPEDLRYMVTIDGGSSGSRVHVHIVRIHPGQALPEVKSRFTHKVKPGLSSFVHDPIEAGRSIRDLLEHALDNVPKNQWRRTPVFLKATAGLRSVQQAQAAEILDTCAETIARTAFAFRSEWASVISGKEEGTFGWMAANYLMGRLPSQPNAHLRPVGVIEMGGASIQISFSPMTDTKVDEKAMMTVSMGDMTYRLYTHSFLGFGLDQALDRLSTSIGARSNPCLPTTTKPGNFDQCAALMPKLLQLDKQCPVDPCSLNGVYQPSTTGIEFIAIENFFYTSDFFDVASQPHMLDDVARGFCNQDLKALSAKWNEEPPEDVAKRCFNAAYVYSILTSGFGFDEPFPNVKFIREVDGVGIDWAIGSVLHEALQMASPISPLSSRPDWLSEERRDTSSSLVYFFLVALPVAVVGIAMFLLRPTKRGLRYGPLVNSRALPTI